MDIPGIQQSLTEYQSTKLPEVDSILTFDMAISRLQVGVSD